MKRHGNPQIIVTDKLRSYGAAMKLIGNAAKQETGRWLNNRAEKSHLPFRRREQAMLRFRQVRCLQKFAAVHSTVCNHSNQERAFYSRDNFKLNRAAALAEWRQFCSAWVSAFRGKLRLVRIGLTAPYILLLGAKASDTASPPAARSLRVPVSKAQLKGPRLSGAQCLP